ncbi:cupin domain-containing protein [Terrisporobacter sp.]
MNKIPSLCEWHCVVPMPAYYMNMNPYVNPYGSFQPMYNMMPNLYGANMQMYNMAPNPYWFDNKSPYKKRAVIRIMDYGPNYFVINIGDVTDQNNTFRTAIWTGGHLQVTVMSINVGDDIGLEVHNNGDQFIIIEEGEALVRMGDTEDNLDFQRRASDDDAIMIPAGKWHNIINVGNKPLKVYVIYGPPQHPLGTVHQTKADAQAAESRYRY